MVSSRYAVIVGCTINYRKIQIQNKIQIQIMLLVQIPITGLSRKTAQCIKHNLQYILGKTSKYADLNCGSLKNTIILSDRLARSSTYYQIIKHAFQNYIPNRVFALFQYTVFREFLMSQLILTHRKIYQKY